MTTQREETEKVIRTLAENMLAQLGPLRRQLIGQEVWIRHVPNRIERDKDGVVTQRRWRQERVTRESYLGINKWIVQWEGTADFKFAVARISELLKLSQETVSQPLGSFLLHIGVYGLADDDIVLLLDDLLEVPPSWQITARLKGIVPASEEVVIQEGVKLRKVRKEDLIMEVPLLQAPYFGIKALFTLYDSILELSFRKKTSQEVDKEIEKLLILLSLYRESAISYESYVKKPKTFRLFGEETASRGIPASNQPRLVMTQQDVPDVTAFIGKLETKLPMAVVFGRPVDPLEISLKRYLDSLRMSVGIEEKLTYAVMGMESLFLQAQPEAQFRLAVRAARVLGHLNEDPSMVYSDIFEAYQYRSLHVHGSVLKGVQRSKADQVFEKIARYLRKVLIFWLMERIISEANKKQFLVDVDAALIDENKAQSLKSKLTIVRNSLKSAF